MQCMSRSARPDGNDGAHVRASPEPSPGRLLICRICICLAGWTTWIDPAGARRSLFVLQWAESLFKELDYRREARNGIRFRELYGDLEVWLSAVP